MKDHLAPLWTLLAEQAGNSDIEKRGREVAQVLEAELAELNRQKRILDEILGWKTPVTAAWKNLAKPVVGDPFAEAVQDILKELINTGTMRVDTKLVLAKVIQRGVQNGRKSPKTAIGNIIFRLPGWTKVGQGVYEFQRNSPDNVAEKVNAER